MKENIIIKPAEFADVAKMHELEKEVWGEKMGATSELCKSRIKIFPEGINLALVENEIVGIVVAHIISWPYGNGDYPSWEEATADGTISNHNEQGEILYGVNLTAKEKYPGVAAALARHNLKIEKRRKLKATIFGSRIPDLITLKNDLGHEPDHDEVLEFAARDQTVRFFKFLGFKIIGVKKDYFERDDESLGWGAMLSSKDL